MEFFKRPTHNQNTLYLSSIENKIQNQTKSFCKAITNNQQKSLESQKQLTNSIIEEMNIANQLTRESNLNYVSSYESLEYAIKDFCDGLVGKLHNINDSIKYFQKDFNEAINLFLDQLLYANKTLDEIALELKIPEIERERRHHLHQALVYFSQNLFTESSQRLLAAKNILQEKRIDETNPFILYFLGYCYYKQHHTIESQEEAIKYLEDALFYFDKAAFYSIKEIERKNESISLKYNIDNLVENDDDLNVYKLIYESNFFAAKISYFLGNFKKSIVYCKDAIRYFPESLELKFYLSKYLCADNQDKRAIPLIESIIREKPEFSIQVALDGDLISKSTITQLLEKLRDEFVNIANKKHNDLLKRFNEIKDKYSFNTDELNSKHIQPITIELLGVNNKIKLNLFMDAVNALRVMDMINQKELLKKCSEFKDKLYSLKNEIKKLENEYISFLKNDSKNADLIKKIFVKLNEIVNEDYSLAEKLYNATELQFKSDQCRSELKILEEKQKRALEILNKYEEKELDEKNMLKNREENKAGTKQFFASLSFLVTAGLVFLIGYIIYSFFASFSEASSMMILLMIFIGIPVYGAIVYGLIFLTGYLTSIFANWVKEAGRVHSYNYTRPEKFVKQKEIVENRKRKINSLQHEISKLESEIKKILNNEIFIE